MSNATLYDIASHFCVSDVPGATIPATRLSNILDCLYHARPVTPLALAYLQKQKLTELHQLASGQISYEAYLAVAGQATAIREQAAMEQKQAAEVERQAREARRLAKEAEQAAKFNARKSDPKYIAKMEGQALRGKYGTGFIEEALFRGMMEILRHLDAGKRLAEEDYVWLTTKAEEHFTDEVRSAYHLLEAEFFAKEYRNTNDPWSVVNASSHYRKCGLPESALELLDRVPTARLKEAKIKSALCTTRGGVMRDMRRLDEARLLGDQAHALTPQDFRPCTLLGAVYMELGNFIEAHDWYAKAEARGASQRGIDSDLRSIYRRADKPRREGIKAFLLAEDPDRYSWVLNK